MTQRSRHAVRAVLSIALVAVLTVLVYAVASYPTAVASFPTRVNGQTIDASWFNALQDEVVAIENGLVNGFAHDLTPDATANNRNVGSSAKQFRDLYLSGAVKLNGTALLVPILSCGRLTLTTAVPVTTSDVTAATTLYLTPIPSCNQYTVFASSALKTDTLTETSVAVPATTSTMYDVFAFDNAGAINIELLAWTNDTTRATAITVQNGFLAKSGDATRKYVGSVRTTTVSGQTEDSATKRLVWNYYNRVPRPLKKLVSAGYSYTLATWRQSNADTANQVAVVVGVAEARIFLNGSTVALSSNNVDVGSSIGEDSTTTPDASVIGGANRGNTVYLPLFSQLTKMPAAGYHFYPMLEYSTALGATSWQASIATNINYGLSGFLED